MIEIIGEVGINANGDLNIAKKMIDAAFSSGCDFVKFQKRVVGDVYSEEELNKPRESPWGKTTRAQKQGLEFGTSEYMEIQRYCNGKIKWFTSPWDMKSLEFAAKAFNNPFIKIPSALLTWDDFLEKCKTYNKPIILSTGMSSWKMIDRAIDILGQDIIYCIMHCTSTYPSKMEELNIKCIPAMKERYGFAKIGFSNHNPGLLGMVMAMTMGAEMIETHFTLDRSMYGSDQAASIEPEGLYKLVKYARGVEKGLGSGEKRIQNSEIPIIEKLRVYG